MTHGNPSPERNPSRLPAGLGCDAALDDLQRLLDGGQPTDPDRFDDHRRSCPECRALHASAGALLEGLARLPRPAPPAGFADRMASAALRDRRRRLLRRRLGAGLALAASLLLVAFVVRSSRPGDQDPGRSVTVAPPTKSEPAPAAPLPPLRDRLAEAGSAVVALTKQAADETLDRTLRLLPRADTPQEGAAPAARLDPAIQSLEEARNGIASGLEPIAGTARRAFDLFRRELSPGDASRKPRS